MHKPCLPAGEGLGDPWLLGLRVSSLPGGGLRLGRSVPSLLPQAAAGSPFPTALPSIGADVRYLSEIKNSGGVMERQKAQEGGLVVGDRRAELTCSGGFGANTGCIVIGEGQGGKRETE